MLARGWVVGYSDEMNFQLTKIAYEVNLPLPRLLPRPLVPVARSLPRPPPPAGAPLRPRRGWVGYAF